MFVTLLCWLLRYVYDYGVHCLKVIQGAGMCCFCLPTTMTIVSGGSLIFPLVSQQCSRSGRVYPQIQG